MWTSYILVEMQNVKCFSYCGKQFIGSSKVKHGITIWSSNYTTIDTWKKIKNRYADKKIYINLYSSTIHNRPKVKIIHISINRWIDKQNLVYTHNGILSNRKKWMKYRYPLQYRWALKHFVKYKKSDRKVTYYITSLIWYIPE